MKSLFTFVICFLLSSTIYCQSPWLDNSFNGNGIVIDSVKNHSLSTNSMNLQSNGDLILAGANGSLITGITNFGITRLNSFGLIDTTFGTSGRVSISMGTGTSLAYTSELQTDGKIVVAGTSYNGNDFDYALVRLNIDGSIDTLFDFDGKVITSLSVNDDLPTCIAIQPDGKIIVAGYTTDGSHTGTSMARYLTDGSLDTTFNGTGIVLSNYLSLYEKPASIALNQFGQIILAGGKTTVGSIGEIQLLRYNSNGSIDLSFGILGEVNTDIGTEDDAASAIVIQPDNKIVIAGSGDNFSPITNITAYDFIFARYLPNGDLDTTFGVGGKQAIAIGNYNDIATSIALDSNLNIVSAGYSNNSSNFQDYDFALVRLTADGNLDSSFAYNGKLTTPILAADDLSYCSLIQPDGKIISAGSTQNVGRYDLAVVRYLPSLAVGLNDFSVDNKNILVYPNPISDRTTINFILKENEKISINLIDMSGNIVHQFMSFYMAKSGMNHQELIIPSSISKGNYILRLTTAEGNANVKVLIE